MTDVLEKYRSLHGMIGICEKIIDGEKKRYRDCVLDKSNRECIFYAERNLEEWNKE